MPTRQSRDIKNIVLSILLLFPALLAFIKFNDIASLISFLLFSVIVLFLLDFKHLSRRYFFPLLPISLLNTAYVVLSNKTIGMQSLIAFWGTNAYEVSAFFKIPRVILLLIVIVVLTIPIAVYLYGEENKLGKKARFSVRFKYIALLSLISIIIILFVVWKDFNRAYPQCIIYDNLRYTRYKNSLATYSDRILCQEPMPSACSVNQLKLILVIGESERKSSLGIYGYGLQTTPHLSKSNNLIVFRNHYGVAASTHPSVLSILSPCPAKEYGRVLWTPNIAAILKNNGFRCYLISNQGRGSLFNFTRRICEQIAMKKKNDYGMIPRIRDWLSDESSKSIIIVHMRGSHIENIGSYAKLNNPLESTGDKKIDQYNNSLLATDSFIAELNQLILKINFPACIIYTSDHGENLNDFGDGNYGHNVKNFTKYELELPFYFLYNHEYEKNHQLKVRKLHEHSSVATSHDNISHFILGLANIKSKYYRQSFDLSSDSFMEHEKYVLDDNFNHILMQNILNLNTSNSNK